MTSGVFPPDIISAALLSRQKWDIPASVCLAQWALESAWGSAMPAGSNNPFGIKAGPGQESVSCPTREDIGGRLVATTARFRKFGSIAEAFDEHGALLAAGSPYVAARRVRHDADAFADALTGIYATDHLYGAKLIAVMKAHNLYAYDAIAAIKPAALPPNLTPSPVPTLTWWQRLVAVLTRKAA